MRLTSRASSAGAVVLAALVPKCPLCVAAMMSALGVGSACATFLGHVARPVVFALALGAVALLVFTEVRRVVARRSVPAPASCCGRTAT